MAFKKVLEGFVKNAIFMHFNLRLTGHHDLNPQKDCPCIENVAKEYADLQPK